MASSIVLSDNGVTSGSAGIKSTGGNDGVLLLQTTTSGGAATTAVTVDNAQNVGVGVTPSATTNWTNLFVNYALLQGRLSDGSAIFSANTTGPGNYATSNAASYYYQTAGQHRWYNAASGTAGNAITFTQAMTLDASGNLLVGTTTSPTVNNGKEIAMSSLANRIGYLSDDSSHLGYLQPYDSSGFTNLYNTFTSGGIRFFTGTSGGTERARIDPSGNLLVGKTSFSGTSGTGSFVASDGRINVVNAATTNVFSTYELYSTGVSAYRFYVGSGGTVFATNTTITGISDVRLKENIRDLDEGLDVVMALKPRKFDWKEGKGADIKNARGFIAQEFEQVLPDMIEQWKDPAPEGEEPYKAVNANLIPTLVKAIQEQQALIQSLTDRLTALEGAKA